MDAVFARIATLDLPIKSDRKTLGGGNCFFHALVQQGKRDGVHINGRNHRYLRERICDFALNSTHPMVLKMKENFDSRAATSNSVSWEAIWRKMRRIGVFVESPVVEVSAIYLQHSIWVISPENKETNPWLEVSCGEDAIGYPILLANLPGVHYQSLLPTEKYLQSTGDDVLSGIDVHSVENTVGVEWALDDVGDDELSILEIPTVIEEEEVLTEINSSADKITVGVEWPNDVVTDDEMSLVDISTAAVLEDEGSAEDPSVIGSTSEVCRGDGLSVVGDDISNVVAAVTDNMLVVGDDLLASVVARHNLLLGRLVRDFPEAVPMVLPCLKEDEALVTKMLK